MWHEIQSAASSTLHSVSRMTPEQWLIACAALMLVGLFCLRGFGSRTSY